MRQDLTCAQAADFLIRFLDLARDRGVDLRSGALNATAIKEAFSDQSLYQDPNDPDSLFSGYGCRGFFSCLAEEDDAEELARVLDAGFPIEAPVAFLRGGLLHLFAQLGAERCVRTLIARGADLEARSDGDETPLAQAASERRGACALALIEAGARWREMDNQGRRGPWSVCSKALQGLANDWNGEDMSELGVEQVYGRLLDMTQALIAHGLPQEQLFIDPPDEAAARMGLLPGFSLALRARLDQAALNEAMPSAPKSARPSGL